MILFRGGGKVRKQRPRPFLAIGAFVRKLSLKELVFWAQARQRKWRRSDLDVKLKQRCGRNSKSRSKPRGESLPETNHSTGAAAWP